MDELMDFDTYIDFEKNHQLDTDVKTGTINPEPVFDLIKLLGFGTDNTKDLEIPTYARRVVQDYI